MGERSPKYSLESVKRTCNLCVMSYQLFSTRIVIANLRNQHQGEGSIFTSADSSPLLKSHPLVQKVQRLAHIKLDFSLILHHLLAVLHVKKFFEL